MGTKDDKTPSHGRIKRMSAKEVEALKKKLSTRLGVLDANRADRAPDEDALFETLKESQALRWLEEDKDTPMQQEQEFVYIFVSSAMRDPVTFPNAGDFKVHLDGEVNNIIKAELVQASIPLVDPTINADNAIIRYSFAPHTGAAVKTVRIPHGSYLGKDLAPEITRQLNQDLHSANIASNTYTVDDATGKVLLAGVPPAGVNQFRCVWNQSTQKLSIQLVDSNLLPVNTPPFALHVKEWDVGKQVAFRYATDDLYDVLGFNRLQFVAEAKALAQFDSTSETHYLLNTGTSPEFNGLFGVASSVDPRFRYSLHSNQAVDFRGNLAVVLDIDPLNDNDIAGIRDTAGTGALILNDYFGFLLLRDPAAVSDRISELTNNSFPVRKYYREGRGRVNHLTIKMRRPDGTIFDFGGVNFFLTIRLTVTRTQLPKPMFARGN